MNFAKVFSYILCKIKIYRTNDSNAIVGADVGIGPYERSDKQKFEGAPIGAPNFYLAATAVVIAAAAVVICNAGVATAAEQNEQDDDPAPVTATRTVIKHKNTSEILICGKYRSFQDIPLHKICAPFFLIKKSAVKRKLLSLESLSPCSFKRLMDASLKLVFIAPFNI